MTGRDEIEWARRVPKDLIRRLYESDAAGMLDIELLDDVGTRLYQRCLSILDVDAAQRGRVRCPRCDRAGRETIIVCDTRPAADGGEIVCPACGWRVAWRDYLRSYKRRQLNLGGAGDAFTAFARDWPRARAPEAKMLAVDRLIHAFHYSFRQRPDMPSRPAGVNLINGKLEDVIRFLDALSTGSASTPGVRAGRAQWQHTLDTYRRVYIQDFLGNEPEDE